MKCIFVWLFIVTSLSVAGPGTSAGSAEEQVVIQHIKKLENDRIQAGVRKDIAFIDAATAEEYVQIDWDGRVLNKAATLARIKSNDIQLRSNTLNEIDVRVYANTAVVTGLATRKGTADGKDISEGIRYTRIYIHREGRWQVVQFQQTRVVASR